MADPVSLTESEEAVLPNHLQAAIDLCPQLCVDKACFIFCVLLHFHTLMQQELSEKSHRGHPHENVSGSTWMFVFTIVTISGGMSQLGLMTPCSYYGSDVGRAVAMGNGTAWLWRDHFSVLFCMSRTAYFCSHVAVLHSWDMVSMLIEIYYKSCWYCSHIWYNNNHNNPQQ